ncbi:hypothetical protein SAMN05444266_10117 [Chitinophaga jiangningensis]|uniref:DKNYY family protein n=1 Tax=Chitinophaga jiangningensis TaxID=1419482 RepID=A0A1M6V0I3_9BACT|nr:hypothetical protein [Chitinophaga jiangningensis]SHK74963.1 hypothetical protein SAMN05444266_10117 [Chitinophaga jiangningensis]
MKKLLVLVFAASMALLHQSCEKSMQNDPLAANNTLLNDSTGTNPPILDTACLNPDATYVDTWHYATPQLYIFKGTNYGRYDLTTHTYAGLNTIADGYKNVPFSTFDAVFVDVWSDSVPKLMIFSGNKVAKFDILNNIYEGVDSISSRYPGLPFTSVDALFVDTVTTYYNKQPQLYIFSGTQYARIDMNTNTYKGLNSNALGFENAPFYTYRAMYVDRWSFGSPQLVMFNGTQNARLTYPYYNFVSSSSNTLTYPGVPFCQ